MVRPIPAQALVSDTARIRAVVGAVHRALYRPEARALLSTSEAEAVQCGAHPFTGHCYVASEAVYHLLGGKAFGLTPMVLRVPGGTHWYLRWDRQRASGRLDRLYVDPTREQFGPLPAWEEGRGCGLQTRQPSTRCLALLDLIGCPLVPALP